MSATGLDVFDKTLQTTHIWLNEINEEIGPDRQLAWHTLGVVLRALRDRLPAADAAHLAAGLPLIVRGAYYDQYRPAAQPNLTRSRDMFVAQVADGLRDARPVDPVDAIRAVFGVIGRHIPQGQVTKTLHSLPEDVRALWPQPDGGTSPRGPAAGQAQTEGARR
jgi:uncharacterized protein (DUF2267 family)